MIKKESTFSPYLDSHSKRWTSIPNYLIRNGKAISDGAFRLLCYLESNSKEWEVYQLKISQDLDWGRDKVSKYIKELENKGHLRRNIIRNDKGQFCHYHYEHFPEPIFKTNNDLQENSKNVTVDVFSVNGLSVNGKSGTTKTNSETSSLRKKSNDTAVTEESVPAARRASEVTEESLPPAYAGKVIAKSETKHPLKAEQQPLLKELQAMDLETTDEVLMILIRKNPPQKIRDAIFHLNYHIKNKTQFKKSKIAFFRHSLTSQSLITENTIKNKELALEMVEEFKLNSIVIQDKYVTSTLTSKDIPLNLEPVLFYERFYDAFVANGLQP